MPGLERMLHPLRSAPVTREYPLPGNPVVSRHHEPVVALSEKLILGIFQNFGIEISATHISQQWTGVYELFHQENGDLYPAGIAASAYALI